MDADITLFGLQIYCFFLNAANYSFVFSNF